MFTVAELRAMQEKVKQFSTEWFRLNTQIEELSKAQVKVSHYNITDRDVKIADYVLSDSYDDD